MQGVQNETPLVILNLIKVNKINKETRLIISSVIKKTKMYFATQ